MSQTRVAITGIGRWVASELGERPSGTIIERRTRRRCSDITRALADAFEEATEQAGCDRAEIGLVVGSALGEVTTMLALLDQMWRDHEMSPMGFAMSVHNAAAGAISISTGNRFFATSIAADDSTVAMALMEACAIVLQSGRSVAVVCGEDASPDTLVGPEDAFERLAGAVVLSPIGTVALATIALPDRTEAPCMPVPERSGPIRRNPQVAMLDLIDAVNGGQAGRIPLNDAPLPWSVELAFGAS